MSLLDAAERIMNKANADGKVAVLIVAGKVKTVSALTKDYTDTLNRAGMRLLGVYDRNCQMRWIEDDLVFAEQAMVQ